MKLDKIRFARLIAYIGRQFAVSFDEQEINDIDHIVEFEAPPAPKCDVNELHQLMALMADGTKKIDAIKLHRQMTGYGLKESKDAVEKYWPNVAGTYYHDLNKRVADALGTAETGEALVEVARNAHRAELELASQYNDNHFDKEEATLGDILSSATRDKYVDG